jgi:hypothetical protein
MAEKPSREAWRRAAFPLAVFALAICQFVLLTWFVSPELVFGRLPLTWIDFETHIEQTFHAVEALLRFGKPWSYDVQLLAGFPNGTVFDADNKAWELWTYALVRLGMRPAVAFNLFVVLGHVALIPTIYASSRLLELTRWRALGASALAVLMWYFDGLTHWCWYIGLISYDMVAYMGLLPVALLWSYLRKGGTYKLIIMGLFLGVLHMVHPYVFIGAAIPMFAIYAMHFRKMRSVEHLRVVLGGALVVLCNLWWLITALRFWHYVGDSGVLGQGSISLFFSDFFGLISDTTVTGVVGNRTGFRNFAFITGALGILAWRGRKDPRTMPFALSLGAMIALTYLGGYVWIARQIQPYRHVLPAMFLALIPSMDFVFDALSGQSIGQMPKNAKWLIGAAGMLLIPYLGGDIVYFIPQWQPNLPPLPDGTPLPIRASGYFGQIDYRHAPLREDFHAVARWIQEHDDGQGRVLVEWWILGEHLSWRTKAQILGGFRQINLQHAAANLWRRNVEGDLPGEALAKYLEDYAVRWVIVTNPNPKLETRKDLLQLETTIGAHRVYRVKTNVNLVAGGDGKVVASMNRLEVSETNPEQEVVLRFHYMESLRCGPDCEIEKAQVDGDPVGFIRVKARHPKDFVVYNKY